MSSRALLLLCGVLSLSRLGCHPVDLSGPELKPGEPWCGDGTCSQDESPRSCEEDCGPCVPATCASLGKTCGVASDGCGGTLDCGSCEVPGCSALVSESCAPASFQLVLEDTSANGQRVVDLMGQDAAGYCRSVAARVCCILYKLPSEPPKGVSLTLLVRDDPGVAWKASAGNDHTIMISSRYLAGVAAGGGDAAYELRGILTHEMTHVYQYGDADGGGAPSWLIEGVADYVRTRAGYIPVGNKQPGGSWLDGYQTTGFFILWLDDTRPGFAYRLNQTLSNTDGEVWTAGAFVTLTGYAVDQLWAQYQATF